MDETLGAKRQQGPIRGLLTILGGYLLTPAIAEWVHNTGGNRAYESAGVGILLLIAAYIPGQAAINLRAKLANLAASSWVWFSLVAAIWLYFASWSLIDHYSQTVKPADVIATTPSQQLEWEPLNRAEIKELSDKLSGFTGIKAVNVWYADSSDQAFAISVADAMNLAGWPDAEVTSGYDKLGLHLIVSADMGSEASVLRKYLGGKFGDEPKLEDNPRPEPGEITISIGRRPPN